MARMPLLEMIIYTLGPTVNISHRFTSNHSYTARRVYATLKVVGSAKRLFLVLVLDVLVVEVFVLSSDFVVDVEVVEVDVLVLSSDFVVGVEDVAVIEVDVLLVEAYNAEVSAKTQG